VVAASRIWHGIAFALPSGGEVGEVREGGRKKEEDEEEGGRKEEEEGYHVMTPAQATTTTNIKEVDRSPIDGWIEKFFFFFLNSFFRSAHGSMCTQGTDKWGGGTIEVVVKKGDS